MNGETLRCPVCSEPMTRSCDDVVRFAHCSRCGGEWVCRDGLSAAVAAETPNAVPSGAATGGTGTLRPADLEVVYRGCPECGGRMNRRQFLPGSGVIIDECLSHGVWLDSEERERILEHVRSGRAAVLGRRREEERRKPVEGNSHVEPALLSSGDLGGSWIPGPLDLLDLNPLDHGVRFVARFLWHLLD